VDGREPQHLREAPDILPCRACACDSSTLRRTCWHVSSTQQSKENDTLLEHSRLSPTLATYTRAGQTGRVAADLRPAQNRPYR